MIEGIPEIVLASGSPRRSELLSRVGIPHRVRPADINESILPGENPVAHVERLAMEKAVAVSALPEVDADTVVLAADTIVVVDGAILGKPADAADASEMLRRLESRSHTVHTAVAMVRGKRSASRVDSVLVTFRNLTEQEIANYVATGEPMDKAGAYGIQGFGATLVRRIEGDFFAVMGLSLVTVVELLKEMLE
ncbi:MAG TPA: Maf family protein [Gemmatimonadales bacterium]|nr:Maf family protein [Gemmatimonadales bacterium]